MTDRDRPDDNQIIERETDLPTPSQGGSSGGDLAREIGQRDEDKTATGESDLPTGVHKGDKPADGAATGKGKRDGGR
jgi:hypothetical protein